MILTTTESLKAATRLEPAEKGSHDVTFTPCLRHKFMAASFHSSGFSLKRSALGSL